jgi:hypothetical protein
MTPLFALLISLGSPTAPSNLQGFMSAEHLERYCTSSDGQPGENLAFCLGYVAGIVDQSLAANPRTLTPGFCPPLGTTVDAFRLRFLNYLRTHPRERDSSAALVLRQAAAMAYPCPLERL